MNKFNHIELLLEAIRDSGSLSKDEKAVKTDLVDSCVDAYVRYHNTAVDQGRSLALNRFRMDFDQYAGYVARLHETRKEMHKSMIDHTAILNQLCRDHGLSRIYEGPLDLSKGRDDPDTRFGVAAFGEELCRDLFKTSETMGVPKQAHMAYRDYAQRVAAHPHASAMQHMMDRARAQSDMDAREYGG